MDKKQYLDAFSKAFIEELRKSGNVTCKECGQVKR
jgi:hypothetical protein